MAATLQHCTPNNRTTAAVTSPNPQLKRLVYSKYRELLGSYNDQANAYIETLPSYMVHKDTGFNLELKNIENSSAAIKQNGICINGNNNNNNNNELYGSGQRMPAQQTYEAPACVQNAMMTKDKKPFTYTPGGIDLSQIKSERMAKRLARNAQAEGATGQQQQNRPTVPNQSPGSASPNAAAASMGAAAMGMPFQVLPPPPPPAPGFKKTMPTTTTNNNNVLQQNQTNNNYTNYQPQQQQQQQVYTPPTPPQQSPIKPMQHSPQYSAAPPAPATPPQQQQTPYTQQQSPQQQQQQTSRPEFRSVAAPTSPAVNVYTRQTDSPRSVDNATPPRVSESPFRFAQQQQQQQQRAPPAVSPLAQQSSPSTASSGASVSPSNQAQTVPWRTQRSQPPQQQQQAQPVVAQSHPQPIYNNVQQQQQQRTPDFSTQTAAYQGPKPTNVGSLYIAPLAPPTEPQAQHIVRQQLQQQQQQRDSPMRQMPNQQQQPSTGAPTQQLRWMSSQPVAKEQPPWARPEENGNVVPSSLNRIKSPPPPTAQQQPQQNLYQQQQPLSQGNGFMPPQQSAPQNFGAQPMNSTGLRLQINSPPLNQGNQNGPKERIIPIQLEQTPTYTPAQPSFAPQQQQYGAGSNPPAPGYVMRTPNQFVDQGYNNFGQQQQQPTQPQRVMSPTLQQLNAPRMVQQTQNNVVAGNKTHIIPIALESSEGTRGPISKTPIVIQNDQRTPPVQSKSFRILQKITDTIDDGSNDDNNANQQQQQQHPVEPQLQRPTFARQMSAQQARHSPTVEQMRRMQIGHEQGNYSTPTTPSTALKYNQQQRSYYDNSQQYLPPSEQQAPEPKKYTGSAIPSRSFKILQAMTQPENAGPGQSDL